jgi:hypothetical protein
MAISPFVVACASSAILTAWLQLFFLRPLDNEAMDMVRACLHNCSSVLWCFKSSCRGLLLLCTVPSLLCDSHFFLSPTNPPYTEQHERQLDPMQIIAVPYDAQRLSIYVGVVVCAVLVEPGGWRTFVALVQLTACTVGIFVLCGASPYKDTIHTVLAAAYFATLCWFDPPIFYATGSTDHVTTATVGDQLRQRLRGRHGDFVSKAKQQQDVLAQTILYSCVAFTVPMQILLLYDRGLQVQRWPVPIILGSTIGWIIGTCLGTMLATMNLGRFSYKKQDEDTFGNESVAADASIGRKG